MRSGPSLLCTRKLVPTRTAVLVALTIWTCFFWLLYRRNATRYIGNNGSKKERQHVFARVVHMEDRVAAARKIQNETSLNLDNPTKLKTEPVPRQQCTPKPWLTLFHSNCNDVHSLGNMRNVLIKSEKTLHRQGLVQIYETGGMRMGGRLVLNDGDDAVIFKIERFDRDFSLRRLEKSRVEALILEELDSSVDVFAFCGTSSITEFGDGGQLYQVLWNNTKSGNKTITPAKKLQFAVNISQSVANLNSMGIILRDIEESNIVFVQGRIKLIDFDSAIPILWNKTTHRPCYPSNMTNPRQIATLAPERLRGEQLSEKVDAYGLGAIFFFILTNTKVYYCDRPRGVCSRNNSMSESELRTIKNNGTLPALPPEIEESNDPATKAIREIMKQALQMDAGQRPSTQEVSEALESTLKSMEGASIGKRTPSNQNETSCGPLNTERKIIPEPVYVASYPGSGSELTLNLIEALTGVETLSYGGKCDPPPKPYDYVALKTHYPWSCKGQNQHGILSRALVLIRNPLGALPSKANRDFESNQHLRAHSVQASESYWLEWRDKNVKKHVALWEELVRYWIDSYDPEARIVVPYEKLVDESSGPELAQDVSVLLNSRGKNVSVVDKDLITCIWKNVVVNDKSPRRSNTHRKKKYQPDFTLEQLDEIASVLARLATQYANTSYGQILAEYRQEVQRRRKDFPSTPDIAWLMSYPNSYNTPIRRLLQVTTNTTGGTNYGRESINIYGKHSFNSTSVPLFPGDNNGPFRICNDLPLPSGGFVLTKTHCGIDGCFECNVASPNHFLRECTRGYMVSESGKVSSTNYESSKVKRAVHLYLHPFSNVITRFRGDPSYENSREGFLKWCRDYDDKFVRGGRHASLVPNEVLESEVLCHSEIFKYVQWHNNAASVINEMNLPVHILYAEEFGSESFEDTVTNLLNFLGLERVEEGKPFETSNVIDEYYTLDELREIAGFIKHYASEEVWATLKATYNMSI